MVFNQIATPLITHYCECLQKGYFLFSLSQHLDIMSARDRVGRHYHEPPRRPYSRGAAPPHRPHPSVLQEELDILHSELRQLAADRRAIAEEHAALQCELDNGNEELYRFNLLVAEIRSEKEACIRELVEKARRLEAELR